MFWVEETLEVKKIYVEKVLLTLLFSLLLALFSQIEIIFPNSFISINFQSLGILLIGYYLGTTYGILCVALYLIFSFLNIPLYISAKGGFLVLSVPTTGYLIGFLFAIYIISLAKDRKFLDPFLSCVAIAFLVHLIIHFFGILWFLSGYYYLGFSQTLRDFLGLTIFPSLLGDFLKSLLFAGFLYFKKRLRG